MVSTDELAALVSALRTRIAWHARAGVWSARAGAPAAAPAETEIDPQIDLAPRPLTLADIRAELGDCTRCKLSTTRNKIVFGNGSETSPIMFVGEGPGADEDRLGDPFVGKAGELLDKMIEAMGWSRQSVYVANTVKCRPPGNRNPEPDELEKCTPFLHAQIAAVRPRILIALGRPAACTLLGREVPISSVRGQFHEYRGGIRIMPTFHPAYLLREPSKKRDAWSDLKMVMAELDRLGIKPPAR
jgi:uracil-DNA glycosylase family 4